MIKNIDRTDRKSSNWTHGAHAWSAISAAMTDNDHLVSGTVLLAMAALAWTVTPLPGLIAVALAIVGGILILAFLDEEIDIDR